MPFAGASSALAAAGLVGAGGEAEGYLPVIFATLGPRCAEEQAFSGCEALERSVVRLAGQAE